METACFGSTRRSWKYEGTAFPALQGEVLTRAALAECQLRSQALPVGRSLVIPRSQARHWHVKTPACEGMESGGAQTGTLPPPREPCSRVWAPCLRDEAWHTSPLANKESRRSQLRPAHSEVSTSSLWVRHWTQSTTATLQLQYLCDLPFC